MIVNTRQKPIARFSLLIFILPPRALLLEPQIPDTILDDTELRYGTRRVPMEADESERSRIERVRIYGLQTKDGVWPAADFKNAIAYGNLHHDFSFVACVLTNVGAQLGWRRVYRICALI